MGDKSQPANDDKIQTQGRKDNAGAERFPPGRKDDSVERTGRTEQVTGEGRRFEGGVESAEPAQGDREPDPSVNQGRLGPGGDPAEGKH